MNILEALIPALDSAASLLLGLFVWTRSPRQAANRLFLGTMAGAALTEGCWAAALSLGLENSLWWAYKPGLTSLAVTLTLATAFSVVLDRRNPGVVLRRRAAILALQALAGAAAVVSLWGLGDAPAVGLRGGFPALHLDPGSRGMLLYLAASLVLIILNTVELFVLSDSAGRRQVKYALLGISGSCLFYLLADAIALAGLPLRLDILLAASIVFLISQALFLMAVVRHRLLQVEVFVSRDVTYRAFLAGGAFAYAVMVALVGWWGSAQGRYGTLFASSAVFLLVVAGAAVLLSDHVRSGLRHYINTHFYRNKYEYRTKWNSFTRRIGESESLDGLCRLILLEVEETMWRGPGTLWLLDEESGDFSCMAADGVAVPAARVAGGSPLSLALGAGPEPRGVQALLRDQRLAEEHGPLLERAGAEVLAPLVVKGRTVGFVTLGPNLFGQAPDQEDREMLKTLSTQAALALWHHLVCEELSTARGLESLNRLSSLIIHDLKNAVSMLNMVLQNAAGNMQKPEFQQDVVQTVSRSAEKIRRLVDQLSFPALREPEPRLARVDLNALMDQAVERLQLVRLAGVTVRREYGSIPPMMGDPAMLSRLFDNLLLNAVQALPEGGGCLSLRSSLVADGGGIMAEVSDNGCGMSAEMIEKGLFRPFRTTKKKGLGIGLYHCRSIVRAHGGTIDAESAPGRGTTFRMRFPAKAAEGPREAPGAGGAQPGARDRVFTVLEGRLAAREGRHG